MLKSTHLAATMTLMMEGSRVREADRERDPVLSHEAHGKGKQRLAQQV